MTQINALLFVMLVCANAGLLCAVKYQLTTFLERDTFMKNNSYPEDYILFSSKNITVQARYTYLQLQKRNSLSGIMARLNEINQTASDGIQIYSSIASPQTSAILENVLSLYKKKFYPLQVEGCLKNPEDIMLLMQKCQKLKGVYIDLIKSLMNNLFLWPVAIITDEDECSMMFSKILQNELGKIAKLKQPSDSKSASTMSYQLRNSPVSVRDISNVLYEIRIKSASIVILLCSDELSDLIFKIASEFSVLRFKKVWLMIQSSTEVHDSIAPAQLLVIKVDDTAPVLASSFLAKKKYVDALNLILVAKDGKTRGIIGNSTIDSLRTMAKKSIASKDCHALHSAKTALVSLRKSQFNWIPLYKWSDHSNLILLSNDARFLRISRSNLHGVTLKIVTALENPFVMQSGQYFNKDKKICTEGILCRVPTVTSNGTIWNETCCIGYLIDLLKSLQNDLWFSTYLYVIEDGFYGAYVNGSWNGVVADLLKGKADLAVAAITSNKQRSTVVDFSEAFMEVDLSILIRAKQEEHLPFLNFAFLSHLSGDLLWSILGVFLAGMILVYILENQSRYVEGKCSKFQSYPLKECFTYFSGLTFQRDLGGHNPKQVATRITAIAFAFGMVIVMTTYTAILTASKVQQVDNDPFLGLKDHRMTQPHSSFKFACLSNSSTTAYFRNSENPTFRDMYLFMKNFNVKNTVEGIQGLFNGKLDAFITEYPMAVYHASKQRDCGLQIVKTDKGKSSWAVAFQKGWAWNYLVSQKILEYREDGFFVGLDKKWMSSSCTIASNSTSSLSSVPIEYFGGLIVVLVGLIGVSLLLLLAENACNRYRKKIAEPVKESFTIWKEQRERKQSSVEIISFRQHSDVFPDDGKE